MKLLVFLLLCAITIHVSHCDDKDDGYSYDDESKGKCNLKPLPPLPDLSNPRVMKKLKSKSVVQIWSRPYIENETPNLAELKKIILEMATCKKSNLINIAQLFTVWGISFLRFTDHLYPNLCYLGKAVNATIEWKETQDIDKYYDALSHVRSAMIYGLYGIKYAILRDLGCKGLKTPKEGRRNCWNNGFSLCMYSVWDYFGSLLPWRLRDVIFHLSHSTLFSEQATALVFNFVLIPPLKDICDKIDPTAFVELAELYKQVGNYSVNKCCCGYISGRIEKISAYIIDQVNLAIDELPVTAECLIEPTTETTEQPETTETTVSSETTTAIDSAYGYAITTVNTIGY